MSTTIDNLIFKICALLHCKIK